MWNVLIEDGEGDDRREQWLIGWLVRLITKEKRKKRVYYEDVSL